MNFVCPKCKSELIEQVSGTAKCENGHSFDKSRFGYYNLLLSNNTKSHGDNKEMVSARRDFLNTGSYYPLAKAVAQLLVEHGSAGKLLDIGCGEGYYTDIIQRHFDESKIPVEVSAFDISKEAVKNLSKRNPAIELCVASAYHMPVADASFDMALNMFSPLAPEEVSRALVPGGIFVMVIPGENHLFKLKKEAYDVPYKNTVSDSYLQGFELIEEKHITYSMLLKNNSEVRSLFLMTPYAYRTPLARKEKVLSLQELECEADFVIFVYKKE